MSNHVTEWLNAYLDGELKGGRLHQVEEHLAECEACQTELESLQGLSNLLQEVPAAEFPSAERFVTQVNLLLPQKRTAPSRPQLFEIGWWMIPVSLIAVWVFISTAVLLSKVVSAADNFGLLDDTTSAWISSSSETADVTTTLGRVGVLSGDSLQWAERSESYTRNLFPQIVWQVAVALLYIVWLAVWWARRTRQEQVPLLEG
ncbi:MAG TPA: zf-HC2 domain-containing protein [Anaerolineales bacterium]|nr:zf-HC2 domain-containing protein [Anaerolineales bacterium]